LVAATVHAQPTVTLTADIAPQPLYRALDAFAAQTGLQVIYFSEVVGARKSRGAKAGLSASAALEQLLDGTGLDFEFVNDRTVSIVAASVQPAVYEYPAEASDPVVSAATLEEIVVTATRREARVGDVPISMVVWSRDAMVASGVKGMADIGFMTPSVEYDYFPDFGAGIQTNIAIRGISARNGTTTAVFLDDTPIPAPGDWGSRFGRAFPLTFGLERVEVLRGAQSTLFGQGAMGGAVRFISRQPSLSNFNGRVQSEIEATDGGDRSYEIGAEAGGSITNGRLGFDLSGWYRSEGGYVDRVNLFTRDLLAEDANRSLSKSARGALTFQATPAVSITPSITWQSSDIRDASAFHTRLSDPDAGVLRNGTLVPQPYEDSFYLASLKVVAGLSAGELTAVTSYFDRTAAGAVHAFSNRLGGWGENKQEYPIGLNAPTNLDLKQTALSQELRLTSTNPDAPFSWVTGVFLSNSDGWEADQTTAATNQIDDRLSTAGSEIQFAVFGRGAWQLTKRLTANAGLRLAHARYDRDEYFTTLGTPGPLPPSFHSEHSEDAAAPALGLEYHGDGGSLFYLTAAKAYRPGGANWLFGVCAPEDRQPYRTDSLWSYELGAKTGLPNGRMQLSGSLFYVDWSKPDGLDGSTLHSCRYLGNAADATSRGFDAEMQALVTDHLKIGLLVAYAKAQYTETTYVSYPADPSLQYTIVRNGDPLGVPPVVPSPWHLTASIDYHRNLARDISISVHADDVFHSRVDGSYASAPSYSPGLHLDPSTNILNFRVGMSWSGLDLGVYVDNALNSQPTIHERAGLVSPTHPTLGTFYAMTFRPRTAGLSASWRF
jgi:outer membrane receptor protein involved in Fe transport